ncbi:hypothetical protein TIFTF001_030730 [Ficus carica]|uniref:Uncharacterized protein n=1 Tax=Ficus carica TaxID=3494 RepID=A0AA88DTX8_FICCA|nr:hypothetical protein TIFTF001_030730 [Ficus carica]
MESPEVAVAVVSVWAEEIVFVLDAGSSSHRRRHPDRRQTTWRSPLLIPRSAETQARDGDEEDNRHQPDGKNPPPPPETVRITLLHGCDLLESKRSRRSFCPWKIVETLTASTATHPATATATHPQYAFALVVASVASGLDHSPSVCWVCRWRGSHPASLRSLVVAVGRSPVVGRRQVTSHRSPTGLWSLIVRSPAGHWSLVGYQ